ncbi:MAG: 23S rRNA (uracil(1939)-C(5))-methyltransferase RlmD, partial [Oliverpabstia sp.]|nr:23S rRNA (uracil(1939)-C(5))-methyltransferase RlmD [Oliverpabstia sp.]
RKGCEESVLETMVNMGPERIVYVSCDSATLARDLKYLCGKGYELEKVRAVDMFPMTVHVETVVLLSQQKPDDTIEIDLDLDELDATSAELKATYQEIKEYVLKEFGLKVSSLYISQVKRKCGIEVGENYNLPKSENARVPQCPKEKEDAIKAALKYFAMI